MAEEDGSELKLVHALEKFSRQSAEHRSGDGEEVDHIALQAVFHKRLDELCSVLIERHTTTASGRRLSAKQIADKVAASNEFKLAKQQLLEECSTAVNELLATNERDVAQVASVDELNSIASSSEPTWFAASLAQSMVIPGTRDVRRVATTLTQRDADPE
uniref:Uncharacterized protein n=1 Tax=Plectus sambesii TaxID=2011161 RepID=A0A914UYE3_9BILA